MASYGYGISVSGSRTAYVAPSAQTDSNLPAQIIVSGSSGADGVYTKTTLSGFYTPAPIGGTFNYLLGIGIFYITSPGNTNNNSDYAGDDWVLATGSDGVSIISENTSTNATIIPRSGWSPSVTITAV